MNAIADTPSIVCSLCAHLMFSKHFLKKEQILDDSTTIQKHRQCESCQDHQKKNKASTYIKLHALGLSASIERVSSLTDIEACLIAIRIPFAQIRELLYLGQLGLHGTVINVMANVGKI